MTATPHDLALCPICLDHVAVYVDLDEPLASRLRERFQPGAPAEWHARELPPEWNGELPGLDLAQLHVNTAACLVCLARFTLDLGLPPGFFQPLALQWPDYPEGFADAWPQGVTLDTLPGAYGDDLRAQVRQRAQLLGAVA
jgi:hypothetical protein